MLMQNKLRIMPFYFSTSYNYRYLQIYSILVYSICQNGINGREQFNSLGKFTFNCFKM